MQKRQRRKNDPEQYLTAGELMYIYRNSMEELKKLMAPYLSAPTDLRALPPRVMQLLAVDMRQ